ncbi:hypothetical protein RyT2_07720 [Pseudolactococcus yaeyamensis]
MPLFYPEEMNPKSEIDFLFHNLTFSKQKKLIKIAQQLGKQDLIILDEERKIWLANEIKRYTLKNSDKIFEVGIESVANDLYRQIINLSSGAFE